jgi:hypothetical protein
MNDTSPEIEEMIISMMVSKTPEQRLKMVNSMVSASKELIKAGLEKEKGCPLTKAEIRTGIFLRMYGDCFSPKEIATILSTMPDMQIQVPQNK